MKNSVIKFYQNKAFVSCFLLPVLWLANMALLSAQPFGEAAANYRIKAIFYQNSGGEKAVTSFRYDDKGRLKTGYWELGDQSRHSVNNYFWDKNGNLVSAFRTYSDGIVSTEFFIYDSLGNKIEEYFSQSDNKSGKACYTYENGHLVSARFLKYKGWLKGTIRYNYDKNLYKTTSNLVDNGNNLCSIDYQYDEQGNLIREHWDFNGKWQQTFEYKYERIREVTICYSNPFLSASGNCRLKTENYSFNGTLGGPSFYRYNCMGQLATKEFIRSDSVSTSTAYSYDKDNLLTTSVRKFLGGKQQDFVYLYDDQKRLIERVCLAGDSLNSFERYCYDDEGILAFAWYKNVDGWLSGTIALEHDWKGRFSRGNFMGSDGSFANISFQYNNLDQLTAIRWDFSFGKYQEYTFEYETLNE